MPPESFMLVCYTSWLLSFLLLVSSPARGEQHTTRTASLPPPSSITLISQAQVQIISPRHGDSYLENDTIPIQLDISLEPCTDRDIAVEGSEKLWFHIKVDRQDTQPLVIDLQTPRDQQEAHTKDFAARHGLSAAMCHYLWARVEEALSQLACPLPSSCPQVPRQVCLILDGLDDDTHKQCYHVDALPSHLALSSASPLSPGAHTLAVHLTGFPGRPPLHQALSVFQVLSTSPPSCLDKPQPHILYPKHGATVWVPKHPDSANDGDDKPLYDVEVVVALHGHSDKQEEEEEICVSVREMPIPTALTRLQQCMVMGAQGLSRWTLSFRLPPGKHWIAATSGHSPLQALGHPCGHDLSFQVEEYEPLQGQQAPPSMESITFITGASQSYYDERRLQNLIGSIHFWEPEASIDFYNLGLNQETLEDIQSWANVVVREVPLQGLPPHVGEWTKYAFKPVVMLDALTRHNAIFWIDANAELRRPMDDIRYLMSRDGHFFTTQPYDFPTPQFHHPDTVAQLGCQAPDLSRQHCSTAFVGITRDGWAHTHLLLPTVACALQPHCINPPGSHRGNHRQEQTVVNSIMCHLNVTVCHPQDKYRMTSDFENDDYSLQPTQDERDWNDMVFYTRRDFPLKPYLSHLRRRPPSPPIGVDDGFQAALS